LAIAWWTGAPSVPGYPVQQLQQQADVRTRKDSRVLAVGAQWSACMRKAGFFYTNPWDANNDPRWTHTNQPTDREIATARADVACRTETGLVDTWYAVLTAHQNQLIEANSALLADLKQYWKVYKANIQKVLRGGG